MVGAARRRTAAIPEDPHADLVLRAAVSGASLSSADWAGALTSTAVADFVADLGAASAASQLIAAGMRVALGRALGVRIPGIINSASAAAFVAEGAPIPVQELAINGPTLKPHKLSAIVVFTRETAAATGFEAIARQSLRESVGLSLDAAMLSTAAATDERPAGILNGAASVTATAGGGDNAMIADLAALAEAVAPLAGEAIAFIASPGQAAKVRLRARAPLPYPVWASAALAPGTVMAVATNALAFAADPIPDFDPSTEGVLHMENTAPAHIGTEAGVAAPTQSLFQTDCVRLRMILGTSWALRAPTSS